MTDIDDAIASVYVNEALAKISIELPTKYDREIFALHRGIKQNEPNIVKCVLAIDAITFVDFCDALHIAIEHNSTIIESMLSWYKVAINDYDALQKLANVVFTNNNIAIWPWIIKNCSHREYEYIIRACVDTDNESTIIYIVKSTLFEFSQDLLIDILYTLIKRNIAIDICVNIFHRIKSLKEIYRDIIEFAIGKNNINIISYILEHGYITGDYALAIAMTNNHLDYFKLIIPYIDVTKSNNMQTLQHIIDSSDNAGIIIEIMKLAPYLNYINAFVQMYVSEKKIVLPNKQPNMSPNAKVIFGMLSIAEKNTIDIVKLQEQSCRSKSSSVYSADRLWFYSSDFAEVIERYDRRHCIYNSQSFQYK